MLQLVKYVYYMALVYSFSLTLWFVFILSVSIFSHSLFLFYAMELLNKIDHMSFRSSLCLSFIYWSSKSVCVCVCVIRCLSTPCVSWKLRISSSEFIMIIFNFSKNFKMFSPMHSQCCNFKKNSDWKKKIILKVRAKWLWGTD